MPLLGLTLRTSQSFVLWVGPTGETVFCKAPEMPASEPWGPGMVILEPFSGSADPHLGCSNDFGTTRILHHTIGETDFMQVGAQLLWHLCLTQSRNFMHQA